MEERRSRSGDKDAIFDIAGITVIDASGGAFPVPRRLYKSTIKEIEEYFMSDQYAKDLLQEKGMVVTKPYVPKNSGKLK